MKILRMILKHYAPYLELRLITEVSWWLVWSRICDALAVASAGGSKQGLTPTMRLPPKTRPVRPRAFCACSLVWKRMFIQLPFGGIWCCKMVPPKKRKRKIHQIVCGFHNQVTSILVICKSQVLFSRSYVVNTGCLNSIWYTLNTY